MNRFFKLLTIIVVLTIGYSTYLYIKEKTTDWGYKVVICVPVYGQSLALGEEAIRITNFDSLKLKYDGRIVTECLDYGFGYIDDSIKKQKIKKFFHYRKRSFELSLYKMAEVLATELGNDTVICIFPGGKGMSGIDSINKPNPVYNKFLHEIKHAYKKSKERGWKFYVPAICWMQGESDIIDYTNSDYKRKLKQFHADVNKDIKAITHQKDDIRMICYQSNVLTWAENFDADKYQCIEMRPSQAIVDLIKEDTMFWASGPTYPYSFINEKVHIDAIGQQHIGSLDAIAIMNILKGKVKSYGLIPRAISTNGNDVLVYMNVPYPPLIIDTISVLPVNHYGFSIITEKGENIISKLQIEENTIKIKCTQSPKNCKIRYAVNGEKMKSGYKNGPRGNLRDSQGEIKKIMISGKTYPLHNWCYQFDIQIE